MPAVAKQAVVCPVGRGRTHADHSDPVNKEHHDREDGQTKPAVGDDLVDLIGGRELTVVLFLVAALDDLRDVNVALVGDDALGIVVQLGLGGLDVRFDVLHGLGRNSQLFEHLIVELGDVDLVAVLADHVHHVDGDDHGDAQLGELRR